MIYIRLVPLIYLVTHHNVNILPFALDSQILCYILYLVALFLLFPYLFSLFNDNGNIEKPKC